MNELSADTHPGRPDGAEIEVAPHGTRGAGPTDLVEANNEKNGCMDDESGGGDETRGKPVYSEEQGAAPLEARPRQDGRRCHPSGQRPRGAPREEYQAVRASG